MGSSLINALLVFIGSGIGGVLRYAVSCCWPNRTCWDMPWQTTLVNMIGSFLIGLLSLYLQNKTKMPYLTVGQWQVFWISGFLGGLTTYSKFMLESSHLLSKSSCLGLIYLLFNIIVGLLCFQAGVTTCRHQLLV